jgi:serine/threonine-protein kinase
VIPKPALEETLKAHPPVAAFLTEILGRRLLEDQALRRVGKYVILKEIGHGAMATVFEGYHPGLSRGVAIKMLAHGLVYRSDFAERFRNEAKVLAQLRNAGIVDVYDLEEAYGTWFLVMEKLEGTDLERILAARGRLPPDEVRGLLRQVAAALAHAHARGIVHRDVKPSNVFLLPDGRTKLVDFGISTGPIDASEESEILCSPAYVAPEVVLGKHVDGRADVYSLGVVAFRLLSGRHAFPATDYQGLFDAHVKTPFPDVAAAIPGLPPDLLEFVERATRKRPEDRFPDVGAVLALLEGGRAPATADAVLRVRYPAAEAPAVARALDVARDALRAVPGATVE